MIRYSQDFKDSLVKLYNEGRTFKSLAAEFGPSKNAIAVWVKQSQPVVINGESKTVKDIKKLERENQILREENEILSRIA
ncbi:MAG: transposase [Leuconostoc mesenteroides]|uniref:transposase n=1 Tax=Leuconostoc TaxID=1243 RepID=UPI001E40EAC1|nr:MULTISPECIES: transposase [Leuconostoc]MCC7669881.1 transposase [Leuconostoc pseudomesenteroides]MCT3054668.1 transposase [Leuconostoc citreum]MCT3062627.1 transposase [Leuconostoc citreum]